MLLAFAAIVGVVIGLAAHDLAAQVIHDQSLRPLVGTCPECGARRGWNRLRCTTCGTSVRREPVVAVAAALVGAGISLAVGLTWLLVPFAGFLLLTTALTLTDIDEMRIVDRLNLRGSPALIALLGVASLLEGNLPEFWRSLAGGAAYFAGALLLFVLARGNGFGAGDVKLAPVLGVFTSYFGWTILGRSVIATAFIGGLLAAGALMFSEAKRDTELPYGPAMVLGAWVAIVTVGISAI